MKKRGGHWCWCCDSFLPNERFRGRDHGRHLCKDCRRLPEEERAWRQVQRDILRIWVRPGKKSGRAFAAFLRHEDPRIRAFARELYGPFREDLEDPAIPWPLALEEHGDPGPSDVVVRKDLAEAPQWLDEQAFDEQADLSERLDEEVCAPTEAPPWLDEEWFDDPAELAERLDEALYGPF